MYVYILFHYGVSQDIEYSSLSYTVRSWCLFILYIIIYICYSQTPNPPTPHSSLASVLYVYESVSAS